MERIIEMEDVRIAVDVVGSDGDPAIVLAMGATASMLGWPDEMVSTIAANGFRVVRYDHRDTGLSTTWPLGEAPYDVEDMLGDLIGVLDATGIDNAHLVGMSLGGYLSQAAAIRHPARVATLTLIASEPLGWDGPDPPGIDPRFLDHFATFGDLDWNDTDAVEALLVESSRLCAAFSQPFDEQDARRAVRAVIARSPSLASAYNHGTVTTRDDWQGAFGNITQPTLVIHGNEDPILPLANGEALAAGIPDARMLILEGVGHELPSRSLPEVCDNITAFVTAHSP